MTPPPPDPRTALKDLPRPELLAWAAAHGARPAQAERLWAALYRRLISDPADIPDLDAALRQRLADEARFDVLTVDEVHTADDGTAKLALRTADGASIESVVIPGVTGEQGRATLCISSQVGCAMNCQFCLTAKMGLSRHLTTAEMVDQVVLARRRFPDLWLSNVVFMGMGEPLHNLANVIAATHILCDDQGLGLSHRRVTVSTSGIIPAIQQFFAASPARLAVSINATTEEIRDWLMPVNRKYPLRDLLAALRALPLRRRERITLEYVLLADVNDTPEDAERLAALVQGLPCKLNLIPWNPHPGSEFRRSSPERVAAFKAALQAHNLNTSIRTTRGDERMAACGQLGRPSERPPARTRRPPGLVLV